MKWLKIHFLNMPSVGILWVVKTIQNYAAPIQNFEDRDSCVLLNTHIKFYYTYHVLYY